MRKKRRKRFRNKWKKLIFIYFISFGLLFLLSYGYAAFSTSVQVDVTGKTKKLYVDEAIKKFASKNNVTMMTDQFGNIRYTGPNDDVNNYVCLVDETPCQDKNLFRIIGSFLNIDDGNGNLETRVKLIKATKYIEDKWDTSGSNNWARPATLNITLNTTYYDSLDDKIQNIIGNVMWNLGAPFRNQDGYQLYNDERNNITNLNNEAPSTWIGKIALMYPSDYFYSSSLCNDGTTITGYFNDSNCKSSNWLFMNNNNEEWMLSPSNSINNVAWRIHYSGSASSGGNVGYHVFVIRPTFFLKSNTTLITKNRDGTLLNPYLVKLDE